MRPDEVAEMQADRFLEQVALVLVKNESSTRTQVRYQASVAMAGRAAGEGSGAVTCASAKAVQGQAAPSKRKTRRAMG